MNLEIFKDDFKTCDMKLWGLFVTFGNFLMKKQNYLMLFSEKNKKNLDNFLILYIYYI